MTQTPRRLQIAIAAVIALAAQHAQSAGPPLPDPQVPASRPADAVRTLWKTELGKPIVASVAVEGQSVFVADQAGRLTRLDLATGRQQWQTKLADAIAAAPLVVGGVVYVGDEAGAFHAVQADTGNDQVILKTGDKIVGQAAAGKGVIYVGSYDRSVYAMDTATGKQRWTFQTQAQVNASPVVSGQLVMVAGCDGYVRGLDAATGKEQWSVDVGGPIAATPLAYAGRVYAASLKGDRVAIDPAAGKLLWRNREQADVDDVPSFMSSPVITPNTVAAVSFTSQSGQFLTHDQATGKWQSTRYVPGRVTANPAIWRDQVYFATEEGKLYGPPRSKGDGGLWFTAGGAIKASPAPAGDRLLVADEGGTVWCLVGPWEPQSQPVQPKSRNP